MNGNPSQTLTTPAPNTHVSANTFRSIDLRSQDSAEMPFAEFVKTLLEKLEQLKKERSAFYENLRREYTRWANGARYILTLLGAARSGAQPRQDHRHRTRAARSTEDFGSREKRNQGA